jgi:hypothetical protein
MHFRSGCAGRYLAFFGLLFDHLLLFYILFKSNRFLKHFGPGTKGVGSLAGEVGPYEDVILEFLRPRRAFYSGNVYTRCWFRRFRFLNPLEAESFERIPSHLRCKKKEQ